MNEFELQSSQSGSPTNKLNDFDDDNKPQSENNNEFIERFDSRGQKMRIRRG